MQFEKINKRLQIKLMKITERDSYPMQLSPKLLYRNILCSYGSTETLARIFDVPIDIVKEIKSKNKNG